MTDETILFSRWWLSDLTSAPPADIILVVSDIFNSWGDTSSNLAVMFRASVHFDDTDEPPDGQNTVNIRLITICDKM